MENDLQDLQVSSFVNDRYYARKEQEKETKRIQKLKIYQKTLKLLAVGATLAIVGTQTPKIVQIAHNVVVSTIEHDNKLFNIQKENQANKVEELTGRTIEEITESGRTR